MGEVIPIYEIKNSDGENKEHTGEGYIILTREIYKNSKTWQALNPAQKIIMITLILMANYRDGQWWDEWKKEWVAVKRGQLITSLESIRKACGKGISIKNIRTALVNLEKMGFLANQSAKHYRLITLVKYDLYQTQDNYLAKQSANARQMPGKCPATNKQGKQDKQGNQNKRTLSPKTFADDSQEMILSQELKNYILGNNPNGKTPQDLNTWAREFDRMLRLDNREIGQVREVMKFCQSDSFWMSNVLGASKLREKFDTLYLQMKKKSSQGKSDSVANKLKILEGME